ncbi:myo-inositol-1(or 4)-monophosphatase [Capronia epimyces CBS 606.96]|uniref:Inositol-1-monophosphatase n=1 Tax=Capronia epimyces CBS 606.96 TaxID=1182542 RepID=W9YT03_9EURO|nr:myo-inositol-1(or 4)-monophosphatase [Capronia epimyces CBS 606.96]EXJ92810.1 myo-inositol-1(or 4)-monophosphatase [Capronia epimyces CBS 606.96]
MDIDLAQLRDRLVTIALQAGEMITSAKPSTLSSGTKKNTADLVTETDRAVEAYISTELKRLYPSFAFMGEETYTPGQKLGPEPTFVVDPIDGTTNFVHRHPYVSVSLGFAVDKVPTVGVVYNPFTGKLYSGVRGQGSYVREVGGTGNPTTTTTEPKSGTGTATETETDTDIHRLPLQDPAPLTGLDSCIVISEFGSDRSGSNWKTKADTWARLGRSKDEGGAMVHSVRALGSAALNLCAVAEGSLDVYWEGGCWAWDVCAGWVILTEAGGIIVDANPGTWHVPVDHRKYLAVRGATSGQKELVEEFWANVEGTLHYEH